MTEDIYPLLAKSVKGKTSDDLVFSWKHGRPVKDFRGTWSTLCESASIKVLLHGSRRTAVRNLIRAGVSCDVARKISGHEAESVFSRYSITEESGLADAARKLEISRRECRRTEVDCKPFKTQCPSGGTGRRASFRS
jgi:Phage integrase family